MTLEHQRPLRADAERNRRRILTAAAEVFADRGLDAGLDEIARRAGVGIGTVYRRFPDKASLIEALFISRVQELVDLTIWARQCPDAWSGLVTLLTRSVEIQLADRGLKELIHGDVPLPPVVQDQVEQKLHRLTIELSGLLERAKAEGRVRPDVSTTDLSVCMEMLHGVGTFAAEGQWRRQLALVLDGLRSDVRQALPAPKPT